MEVAVVVVGVACLVAAHVYVQLHTRRVVRMIQDHRAEIAEGERQMRELLEQLKPDVQPVDSQYPMQVPVFDEGVPQVGFRMPRVDM